jgi:hypothetical protein
VVANGWQVYGPAHDVQKNTDLQHENFVFDDAGCSQPTAAHDPTSIGGGAWSISIRSTIGASMQVKLKSTRVVLSRERDRGLRSSRSSSSSRWAIVAKKKRVTRIF